MCAREQLPHQKQRLTKWNTRAQNVRVGLYQLRKVGQKGVHLKLHPEENEYKEHTTKEKKKAYSCTRLTARKDGTVSLTEGLLGRARTKKENKGTTDLDYNNSTNILGTVLKAKGLLNDSCASRVDQVALFPSLTGQLATRAYLFSSAGARKGLGVVGRRT